MNRGCEGPGWAGPGAHRTAGRYTRSGPALRWRTTVGGSPPCPNSPHQPGRPERPVRRPPPTARPRRRRPWPRGSAPLWSTTTSPSMARPRPWC
ncbi:hypothetical protein ACFFX0_14385 [Citricoccus parietis]|uniref:Uncharacterized protein n=1 Tax=Citricoccus parietis TaxID=592307 RepID=A0ABV5G047_9MICC